jgi:hypothetical protein
MSDGVRVRFSGGPLHGLIGTVPPSPLAYRHYFREDDEWWSVLYLHGPGESNGFPLMTAMSQPERVD